MKPLEQKYRDTLAKLCICDQWMTPGEHKIARIILDTAIKEFEVMPNPQTSLFILRVENLISARVILQRLEAQLAPGASASVPLGAPPPDWLLRNINAARRAYHVALDQYEQIFQSAPTPEIPRAGMPTDLEIDREMQEMINEMRRLAPPHAARPAQRQAEPPREPVYGAPSP